MKLSLTTGQFHLRLKSHTEANIHRNETEDLRLLQLRQSMSLPEQEDDTINTVNIDEQNEDTFRLHFNAAEKRKSLALQPNSVTAEDEEDVLSQSDRSDIDDDSPENSPRPATEVEAAPAQVLSPTKSKQTTVSRRKKQKVSKHGLKVPALPSSLMKRLGMDALISLGRRKSRIGRDSLKALEQATEWFFEQIGEDLEAYSQHAGRKRRIDDSDVLALMKR